ncbi:hypothetical protein EST38_g7128 [Candolleomyces aberdarensis]|uniref:Major facilitator superfamily (MFS) profile domain-containing protein n=1 Tax=Candolleomyces aberdarensis TaxID=2316362 RepID=A0A4Q2DFY1_9AGAR|nr:hypothetical protein EST38_g7128 [Candolleomyces aberdarensis]
MEKANEKVEEVEVTSSKEQVKVKVAKASPGASWKTEERHVLPENNILLVRRRDKVSGVKCQTLTDVIQVFTGFMACIFLAALDQTIIATALPTIVHDLGGGNLYSWVGTSYMLAGASLTPLYGKLSDLIGRKPILYASIICFLIGSALCGAAQTMVWLIIARAVQGIGGGGIIQLVNITISDIVSLEECFFINLPTGGVAAGILFWFLNLNPHQGRTFREHVREFDFAGLFLIVAGLTRTTSIILITTFLHAFAFFAGAFYLPLYYQVLGASAMKAGVEMLPYSLGCALTSAVAGIIVTRTGRYREMMWISFAVFAIGMGLMTMLDGSSSTAEKVIYTLIAALGLGCLFQTPLIGLQAAMPIKDMATSTATFGFIRTLGGTVGISAGQTIFSSVLLKKLAKIPDLPPFLSGMEPAELSQSVYELKSITDPALRSTIIEAYTRSISTIWIVATPVVGLSFVMVLFLKKYTLKRIIVKAGDEESGSGASSPTQTAGSALDESRREKVDESDGDKEKSSGLAERASEITTSARESPVGVAKPDPSLKR